MNVSAQLEMTREIDNSKNGESALKLKRGAESRRARSRNAHV